MRKRFSPIALAAALAAVTMGAAAPSWVELTAPLLTSSEKKAYLAMSAGERQKFETAFWTDKNITAAEYEERVHYIDAQFGSGKLGSGANTDQGRVYLSLGPPNKITRLPSSRKFQPIEIWYYSTIPGVLNSEVSLMFFQRNGTGYMKLYSPVRDTIRALLLPQASNVHLFGPNDDLNESQIRENLQVAPGEDEVIPASVHVSAGVRYEENDTILAKVSSPEYMLGQPLTPEVSARFFLSRPNLDVLQTPSPYGGVQVDLGLDVSVHRRLDMEVFEGNAAVYQNRLNLEFAEPAAVHYTHRLDLLPGTYRVIFNVDGLQYPYSVTVAGRAAMGEILRANQTDLTADHPVTPFSFDGTQFDVRADGKTALLALPSPEKVSWIVRRGTEIVWRATSEPASVAFVALPAGLPPGTYTLEANTAGESRRSGLEIAENSRTAQPAVLSYNANLAPSLRLAFLGHQWLLKGQLEQARKALAASLEHGAAEEAQVDLARIDALAGNLDDARDRVRQVLSAHPSDFEALSVFAYIETRFQDYPVAADLYRRALAVQDSPSLRAALAEVDREAQNK